MKAQELANSLSWAALDRRTIESSDGLGALGAGLGPHVAITAGNRLEYLEALIGAGRAGCSYTSVEVGWTAWEIDDVLGDASISVVITDRLSTREDAADRVVPPVDISDGHEESLAAQSGAPLPVDRCGWKLPCTSGTTGPITEERGSGRRGNTSFCIRMGGPLTVGREAAPGR